MEKYLEDVIHFLDNGNFDKVKSIIKEAEHNLDDHESLCFLSSCNALIYSYLKKDKKDEYYEIFYNNCKNLKNNDFCHKMINSYLDKCSLCINCNNEDILSAMSYINDNLDKDLSLDNVANQIHLSKNYFGNLFKKTTGMRFTQYVNEKRIEKSKALLLNTKWPLDIIAQKCGYNSQSHFSTTFLNIVGTSPGSYRTSNIKKQCG